MASMPSGGNTSKVGIRALPDEGNDEPFSDGGTTELEE
jgi:hypothetical protein